MNIDSFNSWVLRYLSIENAFITKVLACNHYDYLIELGCDEVRLYDIAVLNKINYIGIDIRKELIEKSELYFSLYQYPMGKFMHSCISECHRILGKMPDSSNLCVYPFNLFGNIEYPEQNLAQCKESGCDIVISEFNLSEYSDDARFDYYGKCGIKNLELVKDKNYSKFIGDNFISVSHSPDALVNIMQNLNLHVKKKFINPLIQIYHIGDSL